MKGLRGKAYEEAESIMMYMWKLSNMNNLNPPTLSNISALDRINLLSTNIGRDLGIPGRYIGYGEDRYGV